MVSAIRSSPIILSPAHVQRKNDLRVVTDLRDVRWLDYLLKEFKRINRFQGDIEVVSVGAAPADSFPNVVYYMQSAGPQPCLVNRSGVQPNGDTAYVNEDVFVLAGTETNDQNFTEPYDLFWNAFVFLSRWEEYLAEKGGRNIDSYRWRHPRKDQRSFDVPVVNHLFDRFEQMLKRRFAQMAFGPKERPVVELSHDVDYIRKTVQLRIKQTAFYGFNTLRWLGHGDLMKESLKKSLRFLFSNPSYWCFDYWIDLEKKLDRRSTFYIYAGVGKKNLRSWLMDPSYDVGSNDRLKTMLRRMMDEGFEVGLHGSFDSALDGDLLRREKEYLEQQLGCGVKKTRQHWLRYREAVTPVHHDELFEFDSTLGWNDHMGFRSGCASQYHPYDHRNQRPFKFLETPQVIMDSHIFDYQFGRQAQALEKALKLLESLNRYKSARVSISWHQRTCSPDYGWERAYQECLNVI